jgi:myo-inositol 2-dehydrogenase/D-chiro-inositol 1-dehydrogenase
MMERLRLGVIGAGPIVEKKHLPALAEIPEIAVVALCRRQPQPLDRLADRFGIARRYLDYAELLAQPDIDAVLIATGPEAQPQIAIDAALARKHIFAEKPMAATLGQACRMAEVLNTAGVHFQLGFNKRFYYGYRRAKALLQRGELGELSGINGRFWFQVGRRDAMLHNGIHFLDLVTFFMGPVKEVFARRYTALPPAPHVLPAETVSIALTFATDAVGTLLLSSLGAWDYPNEHIDLIGSNHNVLSVDNGRQVRLFRKGEGEPSEVYENTLSVHWWSGHDEQGFIPQLRTFAHTILPKTAPPSMSDDLAPLRAYANDGTHALAILEAVQGSIAQGASVSIPPDGSR